MDAPQKVFLYLYPISEYINHTISRGAYTWYSRTHPRQEDEDTTTSLREIREAEKRLRKERDLEFQQCRKSFPEIFQETINRCIDERYRQQGYQVNFLLFKGRKPSKRIEVKSVDQILFTEITFKTHITPQPNLPPGLNVVNYPLGRIQYPDPNRILDQLGRISELRLSGFHMWDCVEKMARTAHERGIKTLVDEDLTELFPYTITNPSFRTNNYPTFDPRKEEEGFLEMFLECRKGVPWLWQNY
jgi:hypothetical protein